MVSCVRCTLLMSSALVVLWLFVVISYVGSHGTSKMPYQSDLSGAQPPFLQRSLPAQLSSKGLQRTLPEFNTNSKSTSLKTLASLSSAKLDSMSWLDKGRWLIENNKEKLSYAARALRRNITLVSAMMDLGRHSLGGGFARPFSEYVNRFRSFMAYDYPKIVFLDEAHYDEFKPLIDNSPGPTHVILRSVAALRNMKNFDLIQKIRTNPKWYNKQGWLADSPQAKLELYNPLVMSKLFWTVEAGKLNPFRTDTFLFVDGGHLCNNPGGINLHKQKFILDNFLADRMLVTYFDYTPSEVNGEIHGFEQKAFQTYIGTTELPLRVGRGGIFGGRLEYMEIASQVVEVIMEETLSKGFMGTEENYFSILDYRFPELVHRYENGDMGNCAVFSHIVDPPLDPKDFGYHLRGLLCEENWETLAAAGKPSCFHRDKTPCPVHVTPNWLTQAEGQYTCHETHQYYCTVQCTRGSQQVSWTAHPCGARDKPCFNEPGAGRVKPGEGDFKSSPATENASTNMQSEKISPQDSLEDNDSTEDVYDLRGLKCGYKGSKAVCYEDDPFDRDQCPDYVTPEFLSEAPNQYLCRADGYYCTVSCQEGNENIHWHAHEIKWCQKNVDNCPPRPVRIAKSKFHLGEYEEADIPQRTCESPGLRGTPDVVEDLSLGMLAHGSRELETLIQTLKSYERYGLLDGVSQFMIYLNGRNPALEAAVKPFADRHQTVKLMGDSRNHGILRGINYMAGNSTNPYFLFLEKDFLLIEPWPCVFEQLTTGVNMLKADTAQVLRFRHRWRAGKPNWAKIMFKGDEDRVFKQQPNLFCNHFHWIKHPEKRWPDKIWICNEEPKMYCSESEFCNWTNNPTMMSVKWWQNEYVSKFDAFQRNDPYYDIEVYMNWEPGAWNERHWIVAQGDGLFRHTDRNKF